MGRADDKGHRRVAREVKEKLLQRKSCKIIGNELPTIEIIHAENVCHVWTAVLSTVLSPMQGGKYQY